MESRGLYIFPEYVYEIDMVSPGTQDCKYVNRNTQGQVMASEASVIQLVERNEKEE